MKVVIKEPTLVVPFKEIHCGSFFFLSGRHGLCLKVDFDQVYNFNSERFEVFIHNDVKYEVVDINRMTITIE